MVTIKKVLNSSVILVKDDANHEFILLGSGIGYAKKAGQKVEESIDNQLFVPIEDSKVKHFYELLNSIPIEILQLTQEIIIEAKMVLNSNFNTNLYFVLADHLNFAIERLQKNIAITNRVFWEIKNYYPKEFEVGLLGIKKVKEKLNIILPEEEAANIAFHFANAMAENNDSYDSIKYAKVIGEIVNIVLYSFNRSFDKESIHYIRFITHIKFFVERYFTGKMLKNTDSILYSQMNSAYPKEMAIARKINSFLENKYEMKLTNEELAFLVVHLNRIVQ